MSEPAVASLSEAVLEKLRQDARERLTLAPDGHDAQPVERVSEADHRLVMRLEARIAALQAEANGLQVFVTGHLAAEYQLQQGDSVDSVTGVITRGIGPPVAGQ